MKRPHPFRFVKRDSSRGKVFYVIFDVDPAHPKATGILVRPTENENEPAGIDDAVAWAYAYLYNQKSRSTKTFKSFAKDFYHPEKCTWSKRRLSRGRTFHTSYFIHRQGILKNYILPRFQALQLHTITAPMIDDWLQDLDLVRTGMPLAPATQNRILECIRQILGEAVFLGDLERNVAKDIDLFQGTKTPRKPFSLEEIHILFPEDIDEALRIWLSLEWYGYFLLQWTCGLRPGEAGAFMLSDWIKDHHGAVIRRSVEYPSREIKGLKTDKKGATAKPVVFSQKLESVLTMLEFKGATKEGLLFTVEDRAIGLDTANKHFKASARRARTELNGRTQYSLRHTFYTEMLKRIPEKDVGKMAGHRALRKEYDHRQGVDFLRNAQPMIEIVDSL